MNGRSLIHALAGGWIGAMAMVSINLAAAAGPTTVPCSSDADCAASNPGIAGYGVAPPPAEIGCWLEGHGDLARLVCGPADLMPPDGYGYVPRERDT